MPYGPGFDHGQQVQKGLGPSIKGSVGMSTKQIHLARGKTGQGHGEQLWENRDASSSHPSLRASSKRRVPGNGAAA